MKAKLIAILCLFTWFTKVFAALPPEAKLVIDSLPDKALTMELILVRGAERAESFKEVKSQKSLIPVFELAGEAAFSTRLNFEANHFDDQSDVSNPNINPVSKSGLLYGAGIEKYFPTGTAVKLGLTHSYTNLDFVPFTITPFYETKWNLSLSQSLWQDSFGVASRKELESARLQTTAQSARFESTLEDWVLGVGSQFYEAWLSQKNLSIADQSLKSRAQLLRATQLKVRRGTAEAPDRLQVESVHLLAETRQKEAEQNLRNRWTDLIMSLKLPADWMNVDPRWIPIRLDNPMPHAAKQCESFRKQGVPESENANVRMAKAMSESAALLEEAKKARVRPDLSLFGEVSFNAIDEDPSDSISDSPTTDHPAWAVGLKLSLPLGQSKEKADYLQAYSNNLQWSARYLGQKDDLRIAWLNECANLERLTKVEKMAQEVATKQRERERLEERRFRLGRVSVFNYIQSGDDANEAELFFSQQQVLLRHSAWAVLKISSKIEERLKEMSQQMESRSGSL